MLHYREIAPPPHLAQTVECIWTMRQDTAAPLHRVLPDGCADLLLTQSSSAATLSAVGPMTSYRDHALAAGERMVGVRFRPGRWSGVLAIPGERIVDAIVPLEELWGARARGLLERLANTASAEECASAIGSALPRETVAGPVERAVAFLERAGGLVDVGDLAREAGMSERQFRRVCLAKTGLTPKFLARVLRFRTAAARVENSRAVDLALDCGYYDQAHLIRDFREFAGRTPGQEARPHDSK
jgi:AraC-like DNA-binding protein